MKLPVGQIICGDFQKIVKKWPFDKRIVIVTDPPYNVNANYDFYDDNLKDSDYIAKVKKWSDIFKKISYHQQGLKRFLGFLVRRVVLDYEIAKNQKM